MIGTARRLARTTPLAQTWRKYKGYGVLQRYLRPTDIFLVGHPRSGNTWLSYMMAIAMNDRNPEEVILTNIDKFAPYIGDDRAVARFDGIPDPRLFRNHYPLCPSLYPRTVYIVRDPRSVILSFYRILQQRGDKPETIDEFTDRYLTGRTKDRYPQLVRWDTQIFEWTARAQHQPVIVVKYEDLLRDRAGILRDIFDFIGFVPREESFSLAVE